jgi:hypothetical protein
MRDAIYTMIICIWRILWDSQLPWLYTAALAVLLRLHRHARPAVLPAVQLRYFCITSPINTFTQEYGTLVTTSL